MHYVQLSQLILIQIEWLLVEYGCSVWILNAIYAHRLAAESVLLFNGSYLWRVIYENSFSASSYGAVWPIEYNSARHETGSFKWE